MIRSDRKLKELDQVLTRDSPLRITEAIKVLRSDKPFEGAIGLLISYYDRSENLSIKRLIRDFMNDLKDQSACQEVMDEIKKERKPETMRMLISSCWQSGLNYAAYSSEFAGIFLITGDYMTALECFTVIESSANNITRRKKDQLIQLIREQSAGGINERTALNLELISVLS